jgi:hypothetical protein
MSSSRTGCSCPRVHLPMMSLAMPASRSLIALLVGTAAFFALWIVALKPGGSGSAGGKSQGLGAYQSAINQAHQAVQVSAASNAASGNDAAPAPSGGSAAAPSVAAKSATAAPASPTRAAVKPASPAVTKSVRPVVQIGTIKHALSAHKVVAMLFFNSAAADDRAVKQELAAVPTHRGRVVKLTIPLSQAAKFTAVTQSVPVNLSPTLVLIAPNGQAGEIVGFSDQFEIAQRVDDALAAK